MPVPPSCISPSVLVLNRCSRSRACGHTPARWWRTCQCFTLTGLSRLDDFLSAAASVGRNQKILTGRIGALECAQTEQWNCDKYDACHSDISTLDRCALQLSQLFCRHCDLCCDLLLPDDFCLTFAWFGSKERIGVDIIRKHESVTSMPGL